MDNNSSQFYRRELPQNIRTGTSSITPLVFRNPPPMLPSPQTAMQASRSLSYTTVSSGPKSTPERVELPPIRQAVPEFDSRDPRASYSPREEMGIDGSSIDAFNKRRRVAERDEWFPQSRNQPLSPSEPNSTGYLVGESRSNSNRESSYQPSSFSASRSIPYQSPSSNYRGALPSLPPLNLERSGPPLRSRNEWSEYVLDSPRSGGSTYSQYSSSLLSGPLPMSRLSIHSDPYGYDQPREDSRSGQNVYSQSHRHDRSPFSAQNYALDRPEIGGMAGVVEGTKSRKRRGNLPKETTDKLRAWFKAHLHHPYPTEEEKQELMRQTRLQMNQISNWFINARRRQLPSMINNARVESDARRGRSDDANMPMPERESSEERQREAVLSESGSDGGYDDDYEALERVRSGGSAAMRQMRGSAGYEVR